MARLRVGQGRLAAALALGTAAAVPTVVAFSEEPQGPSIPWGDSSVTKEVPAASAAAAAAAPWSLSRALESFLENVQQHGAALLGDEDASADPCEGDELASCGSDESLAPGSSTSEQLDSNTAVGQHLGPASVAIHQAQAQHQQGQQQHTVQAGSQQLSFRRPHDVSPAALAAQHARELQHMRRMTAAEVDRLQAPEQAGAKKQREADRCVADQAGATPAAPAAVPAEPRTRAELPSRLCDAELMRYAVMYGFLRATTPAERHQAMADGAAAAARTVVWLTDHSFSPEADLQRFAHLVQWQGTDAAGRPVLRVAIGRAVSECRGADAAAFANVLITQVQHGVQAMGCRCASCTPGRGAGSAAAAAKAMQGSSSSSSSPVCVAHGQREAEQLVVVMDCAGASALDAARISWLFRASAPALNQHYPGRLHELILLDLPVVLGWMVRGVKQLVHPETRHKFKVVRQGAHKRKQLGSDDAEA